MGKHVQNMPTQQVIDVMHVKRNIANFVLRCLFGENDTPECRRNMEKLGVMRDLHLHRSPNGSLYIKPCALFVLTNITKYRFLEVVGNIRTPNGYVAISTNIFALTSLWD